MLIRIIFLSSLLSVVLGGITKRDESVQIERTALGESVRLGTLFNARTNLLLNGMELFTLSDDAVTTTDIDADDISGKVRQDTVEDTSATTRGENFGVTAELTLDYMSGAVHVEGSAKYLKDELEKENIVRYTNYRVYQSHFKDLDLNAIGEPNRDYCNMMDQDSGPTHFVSRINYGQRAFMTFDKEYSMSDKRSTIGGKLKIAVNNIPNLEISADAVVDINNNKVETDDSIKVRFYGDALLDSVPTTFDEAVKVYKATDVQQEDGTLDFKFISPLKYVLTPMEVVCTDKAAVAISEIELAKTNAAIEALVTLKSFLKKVNYLLDTDPASRFTAIRLPLVTFQNALEEFYSTSAAKIAKLIPQVRGGADPTELYDFIDSLNSTKFETVRTKQFLHMREREISILEDTHKKITASGVVLSDPVLANDNECIFKHQNVTSLTINILPDSDIAERFLESTGSWEENSWVNDRAVERSLVDHSGIFSEYVTDNLERLGDQKDLNCYMVKLEELDQRNMFELELFQDGKLLNNNFNTPEPYDEPRCGQSFVDGFELIISESEVNGDVTGMKVRVEYPEAEDTSADDEDRWTLEQTIENVDIVMVTDYSGRTETVRVRGLQPDTEYSATVAAVVRHGHGEGYPSEAVTCRTLIASKPHLTLLRDTQEDGDTHSLYVGWVIPETLAIGLPSTTYRYKVSYEGHVDDNVDKSVNQYEILGTPLTRYTVEVTLLDGDKSGETASLDIIMPPSPPSWTLREETASSVSFAVALNELDLTDEQTLESIILSYSKVVDGVATETQEYWHLPTSDISIDDLEQETRYQFSFRLSVRMDESLHFSPSSSVLSALTSTRVGYDAENVRNAIDNLEAREQEINDKKSEVDAVSADVEDLIDFNGSDEVTDALNEFDAFVTSSFTDFENLAGTLERSQCIHEGLLYWGDEYGHDGTFEIGITEASSLPECVEQCSNTENCEMVSLYQDPKKTTGDCHLNMKRILEQQNFMWRKKNSRTVNMNCLDSSMTQISSMERCVMKKTSYKNTYSSYLVTKNGRDKSGQGFSSLSACVSYCRMTPDCEGVTYQLFDTSSSSYGLCYVFSKRPAPGEGESQSASSSVNLACLAANTKGIGACSLGSTVVPSSGDNYISNTAPSSVDSIEECIRRCAEMQECVYTSHSHVVKYCIFARRLDPTELNTAAQIFTTVSLDCLGLSS